MKTSNQIEREFLAMVKDSDLGKAISGTVYRGGMRPDDAKSEDIIVKLLAGQDDQIQTGIILVNIYIPDDTNKNGGFVPPYKRIGVLEGHFDALRRDINKGDYHLKTPYQTPIPVACDDINQHLITIRLEFETIN